MARHSIEFLKFLAGLRSPRTALTAAETGLLRSLATGAHQIVEVGVYEGATSVVMAEVLAPAAILHLVDPYLLEVRLEKWLGFSFTRFIAKRTVRPFRERVRFVRATSLEAARALDLTGEVDLVFIDAVHSYDAVREDLHGWAPKLAPEGLLAFHDSRCCPARPDLTPETGPVRLMEEVRRGLHGAWRFAHEMDSVSVLRRSGRGSKEAGEELS